MKNSDRPSYRDAVLQIQNYLLNISRTDPDIPRVNPDGIYGKTTEESVTAFQRKFMERASGRVDLSTWRELLRRSDHARELLSRPSDYQAFDQFLKDGIVTLGDRSELVLIIKTALIALGIRFPKGENIVLNDVYDSDTEDAVSSFQGLSGLDVNGSVDKLTWNKLMSAYNSSLYIQ